MLGALWLGAILQLKDLPANSTYDYAENCGANNYPQTKLPEAASKPSIKSVYILGGTIALSSAIALLVTLFFVDDICEDDESGKPKKREKITLAVFSKLFENYPLYDSFLKLLLFLFLFCLEKDLVQEFANLAKLAKMLDIWLLLPVTFYLGYELTIIWFEYNRVKMFFFLIFLRLFE